LKVLLDNPHPGLSTWAEAFGSALSSIVEFATSVPVVPLFDVPNNDKQTSFRAKRYEYKIIYRASTTCIEYEFAELGEEGWLMVAIDKDSSGRFYNFAREIPPE